MNELIQQKLLLKNPIIDTYKLIPLTSKELESALGTPLKLPLLERSFIFSCFVCSIDGKVAYPDKKSGLFMAPSNYSALTNEVLIDSQCLMLARAISDAVIIGSNSLHIEDKDFIPTISHKFLFELRKKANKPEIPTIIILCRDLANLDFSYDMFNMKETKVIICSFNQINTMIPNFKYYKLSNLTNKDPISTKSIIHIDTSINDLFAFIYSLDLKIILNESPHYHHTLAQNKLLDEFWLNYTCSYIGGNISALGQNQDSFTSFNHPDTEILTLHHLDYHFLYSRQRFIYR
jgi:riboflavin biosynthesis pyrimidine reductase